MNYNEAKELHREQWLSGKHLSSSEEYEFPYNVNHVDDDFVTFSVPISRCRRQEVDNIRVTKYIQIIKSGVDMGPSWILCGKKLRNKSIAPFWDNKFYVVDGNHRLAAKERLGYTTTEVIAPLSGHEQFMREYNEQNS